MVEVTDAMVEAAMAAAEVPQAERAGVAQYFDVVIRAALEAALASLAEVVETPPPESQLEGAKECECFGDSGLHASTFVPVGSDREHCDLCGYPVPTDSTDVLSAINQPHQAREDASHPPQQEPARLREEIERLEKALETAREALERMERDRDYWKVESEGETAKVTYRDRMIAKAREEAVEEAALIVERRHGPIPDRQEIAAAIRSLARKEDEE